MAYQKKGRKKWYGVVREAGTNRKIEKSFDSKDEAQAWELEYRAAKKKGSKDVLPTLVSSTTTYDALLDYLSKLKDTEIQNELYNINKDIRPIIGDVPLKKLNRTHLKKLYDHFKARGLKDNTIIRRMSTLRSMLKNAEEEGLIDSAPKLSIKNQEGDEVILPINQREFELIFVNASPHIQRMMLLVFHTGLRPGPSELLSVQWNQIDLEQKTLSVKSAKKGGMVWRTIPLNRLLVTHMKLWWDEDENEGLGYDSPVIHYKGKKIKCCRIAWDRTKKKVGITRRLRPYDLRHAFINGTVQRGADPALAAKLAGHADPRTTMRVYRHPVLEEARRAVEVDYDESSLEYLKEYNAKKPLRRKRNS